MQHATLVFWALSREMRGDTRAQARKVPGEAIIIARNATAPPMLDATSTTCDAPAFLSALVISITSWERSENDSQKHRTPGRMPSLPPCDWWSRARTGRPRLSRCSTIEPCTSVCARPGDVGLRREKFVLDAYPGRKGGGGGWGGLAGRQWRWRRLTVDRQHDGFLRLQLPPFVDLELEALTVRKRGPVHAQLPDGGHRRHRRPSRERGPELLNGSLLSLTTCDKVSTQGGCCQPWQGPSVAREARKPGLLERSQGSERCSQRKNGYQTKSSRNLTVPNHWRLLLPRSSHTRMLNDIATCSTRATLCPRVGNSLA